MIVLEAGLLLSASLAAASPVGTGSQVVLANPPSSALPLSRQRLAGFAMELN